jgi:hypothetical protein
MKFLARFSAALIFYILYGVYLANVELKIVPEIHLHEDLLFNDYRGAINVRSDLSDGVRDSKKIIESAQAAGLDFLFFTEFYSQAHNTMPNGYHERLLVTSGFEYKHLDSRILVLGSSYLPPEEMSWKMADWLTQKPPYDREEILILSGPFNSATQPTWGAEWPTGLDAIEVQNPKTIAERSFQNSMLNILWSLLVYPFSPEYAFLRLYEDPAPELQLWDKIQGRYPLVGVSGLDASARAILSPGSILEFPSYQTSFELMSTHILIQDELVGSFEKDKRTLFKALRRGSVYFSLDLLGNPKGFITYFQSGEKIFGLGEEIKFSGQSKIFYKLPAEPNEIFEIVLFRNGQRVNHSNSIQGSFEIDKPGQYRLTVRVSPFFPLPDARKWVTWIYTNSFFVR